MHLLRRESNGEFSLAEYYGQPPPYAILSHTWGSDSDEVTFKDIVKGRGKSKSGYEKLRFCAAQAEKDGLEYFWVDTCCIDKRDLVKLTEAINSMFSWYQHSARCYVYLTDVESSGFAPNISATTPGDKPMLTVPERIRMINSVKKSMELQEKLRKKWQKEFRKSKWFTRGWTLQELLAPASVHFFSRDRAFIGDRESLSEEIHMITGISEQALQETCLSPSTVSIEERMSWAEGRNTKRQEDAAYSLLGLFGVHMPPIYGEGRENAFDRLQWEIERKAARSQRTGVSEALPLDADDRYQHRSSRDRMSQDSEGEMKSWWDKAIAANLDTPSAYENVAVLLVRWADELDDLRTDQEVQRLDFVFRGRFRFHTEILALNASRKPQHQINRSVVTFIEQHDGPHNLLIVYYTGHSIFREDSKRLDLVGYISSTIRGKRDIPSVDWHRSHDLLRSDEVDADVLMILDTAWASNLADAWMAETRPSRRQNQTKRFELMSACPIDHTTAAPGPYSFTEALISALHALADEEPGTPFSTYRLTERIRQDPHRLDTPSMLWSLVPSKSHICLAPMEDVPDLISRGQRRGKGYLKLGLGLRDESLSQTQIEDLVRTLAAWGKEKNVGLRSIDWLGLETIRTAVTLFPRAVQVIVCAKRWLFLVRRNKAYRTNMPPEDHEMSFE